ncbi:MAG: hypothetical protein AAFR96_12965 [Planctomycetota bacterium]
MRRFRVLTGPAALCVAAFCAAALGGCASVWEKNYRPIAPASKLGGGAAVEIREIPWERMERTLSESQARVAASDVHPLDWSDDERLEARAELLQNLQVSAEPGAAQVVGVSSFRTTDTVRPWDGSIVGFAREVGANHVVWSDRYLGKADVIVDYTVTGSTTDFRTRRGGTLEGDAAGFRNESFTVPVVVARDERGFTAFFLRLDAGSNGQ